MRHQEACLRRALLLGLACGLIAAHSPGMQLQSTADEVLGPASSSSLSGASSSPPSLRRALQHGQQAQQKGRPQQNEQPEQSEQPQQGWEPEWMTPEAPPLPNVPRLVSSPYDCGLSLVWHVDNHPFGHPEGIFPWGHLDVWLLDNKGKELGQRLSLPMVHDAAALNWACNGTDRIWMEYGRDKIFADNCTGLTSFYGFKVAFVPADDAADYIHFIGLGLRSTRTSSDARIGPIMLGTSHRTVGAGRNVTCVLPEEARTSKTLLSGQYTADCF